MSSAREHRESARQALEAAVQLRSTQPHWAVVPLFYAALHLMHARFDEDELEGHARHPESHRGHRDDSGAFIPGTRDVIRDHYPPKIGMAYRSLDTASKAVRYQPPFAMDTTRFWEAYEVIDSFAAARPDAG